MPKSNVVANIHIKLAAVNQKLDELKVQDADVLYKKFIKSHRKCYIRKKLNF